MHHTEIKPGVISVMIELQNAVEKKDRKAVLSSIQTYKELVTNTYYNNEMVGESEMMNLERKTLRKVALFLTEDYPA